MKKTCRGCKAEVCIDKRLRCEFGYFVSHVKVKGIYMGIRPLEECPKPRTWDEYYHQVKILNGGL